MHFHLGSVYLCCHMCWEGETVIIGQDPFSRHVDMIKFLIMQTLCLFKMCQKTMKGIIYAVDIQTMWTYYLFED